MASILYCTSSWAAQVTLAWDAVQPAPEGYRVYSRTANGAYNYTSATWTGTAARCTINNLADNASHCFVVRAYRGTAVSANSNEVTFTPSGTNRPPTANAGADQSVASAATVTLNGSGSDPEGQTVRYQWRQTSGTTVQLSSATAARPTFRAPSVASGSSVLAFSLTVTDAQNASASDTCQVMVTGSSGNRPPIANAGADQSVASRQSTTLNGSGSRDPEGKTLRYYWTQKSGPTVTLSDRRNIKPTFIAPRVSGSAVTLTFELKVTDPQTLSATDTCRVTVRTRTSVAADSSVEEGGTGTNQPPEPPNLIYPLADQTDTICDLQLAADAFSDPDAGDACSSSQWQIIRADDECLLMDITQSSAPFDSMQVPDLLLDPGTQYICRVRYLDGAGEPSPWSEEVPFATVQSDEDADDNGIPENQEADAGVDLNQDGLPDVEQWTIIKTLKSPLGHHHIGVSIEASDTALAIERAAIVDPAAVGELAFPAVEMPFGLIGSKIVVEQPGDETTVKLLFSAKMPANFRWYRYDNTRGWHAAEAPSTVQAGGMVVERRLKDGGPDDADGTANGVIVDLSGPRQVTDGSLTDNSGSGSGGGGGGGGCFIKSLGFGRWF